ncbi:Protein of unknown function [Actinokineospora alba]|uniref:ATP-binding protein n=2 Tax=Actinokineospora TaxID=39845 RepID=A0A1H0W053_9PSEU|nr:MULTISPECIES: DUF3107 domain-containing protein [Actinokineospora]MBC6450401.1 DUF3107 domain-containing protein [Actinokineospora xionganensis]TDP67064.1 uncharacterized protein DUF3107 [Actinokineospora alba]SDJ47660.1 Protein of unknown function [Actinokineospora alba]SDP83756.1 Protein of unknown function [Actinokineospora alba]
MEVKVGVADTAREIVLNSAQTPDEVEAKVADALKDQTGSLVLLDDKGRRFVIPSARIAYVEIGGADARKVGFAP